jgi:hypothetical protein
MHILFPGLIPPFSTWPDGNVPSSQLTEHRGIASAACPHVALSIGAIHQSAVIHSFIHVIIVVTIRGCEQTKIRSSLIYAGRSAPLLAQESA